jgi:hypothetical protein
MNPAEPAVPDNDRGGKSLDLALNGAMYGSVAVGVATGFMGIWPLFFAFLPFTVHLVLSALLAAALTTMLERFGNRPPSAARIMVTAAALTFAIFSVLPLYLFFHQSTWPAVLIFG